MFNPNTDTISTIERDRIVDWLVSLDNTAPSQPAVTTPDRPAKRRRLQKSYDCDARDPPPELPTPSLSSQFSSDDTSLPKSSNKRSRTQTDPSTGDHNNQLNDRTPKASRQAGGQTVDWQYDVRSVGFGSSAASSSGVSGTSSPTKQLINAANQDIFDTLNFEPHLYDLPLSLQTLYERLVDIGNGTALLPQDLQQPLRAGKQYGYFPSSTFYNGTSDKAWRIPSLELVHDLQKRAAECDQWREGESSWNIDVHRPVLDFAFRSHGVSDIVDFRYCTSAQIIQQYKPLRVPSKTVDFCVCIKPNKDTPEAQAIRALCKTRPGSSINHTDWGNLRAHPIALSIDTKRDPHRDQALLQLGTWLSSQWRALQWELDTDISTSGIEFLPGIM
ncbi:hypothetical protein F66182_10836, partial [Fusarium sp. NRRL 66182]